MPVACLRMSEISCCRAGQVAHPDAGADRLRERRRVDHVVGGVQRQHRGLGLAREAQLHVGVVLEQHEVVLLGQGHQLLALLARERAAGRVVEVGDDVGQGRPRAALERALQRGHVDAVVLQRDGQELGSQLAQRQQRAVVARGLDHHQVAGLDQRGEQERVGLHRAVGGDHLLGRHPLAVRDPLHQRLVARRRAVRERACRVLGERGIGGGAQVVDGHDVQRGGSTGE